MAFLVRAIMLIGAIAFSAGAARADNPFIIVQSTTSTQNSGLFDYLLPQFTAYSAIDVRVVAVGTGQAIKNAANGDGDVLFVHSRPDEEAFVASGHGDGRFDVMYNDFVLVGPRSDPAGVLGFDDVTAALAAIAGAQAAFVSRGDNSGTHTAEMRLWSTAAVDPIAQSGGWYREAGSGMGATLNIATEMGAYVLTDRATWVSFGNKGDQTIVLSGDARLFNQYGVILVSAGLHPNVKSDLGQQFIDWLLSPSGQAAIAAFNIDGQQLFFPNADAGA